MLRGPLAFVVAVGLAACASGSTPVVPAQDASGYRTTTSEPAPSTAVAEPARVWVAVVDVATDPARLDAPRRDVLRELGNVLEGSVVVSPAECLQGLPAGMTDGYVLAIQRDTRDDVQSLVSVLPRQPSFIGDVTIVCSD